MNLKTILLLLALPVAAFAQSKTPSAAEAQVILDNSVPNTTYEVPETDDWYAQFSGYETGKAFYEDGYVYKILERKEAYQGNFGLIRFDSRDMPEKEIDRMRAEIIAKYRMGTPFGELADTYRQGIGIATDSMDIAEGLFGPEFDTKAKEHFIGDIYLVNRYNNHYVVLKNTEAVLTRIIILQRAPYGKEEE